jgi:primosomal protein N' (replication factor Y)
MERMTIVKNHLLSIAPLVPIPFGKSGLFSYLPKKNGEMVPPGSIVSVSFGARIVRGVVWNAPAKNPPFIRRFRYKAIRKILAETFLSKEQLALAEYMAHESRIALGTTLNRFVPAILEVTSNVPPKKSKPFPASSGKKYRLTPEQKKATKALLDVSDGSPLLFGPPASGKTFVFFELIRTLLKSGGQALILVPDDAILLQEEERYGDIFGKQSIGISHARMKNDERSTLRENIRKGVTRVVIGTNSSLFLPFHNLRLIILDDEDAPSYETGASNITLPTHTIASKLADIHAAKFIHASSTPSYASFFRAQTNGRLIELPAPPSAHNKTWHIVNLRLEQWKKKLSPISDELRYAIASAIERKKQVILFVSRSGMSAFSVCAECKNVVRCQTCSRALSYQKDGEYLCVACKKSVGATPSCPSCGSLNLKHIGIGTERVERDLRRKFPGIRSVRYDKNTKKLKKTRLELRAFSQGERDILITTEQGIRGWDLPQVSLIAMIDADALLGISRWDGDERALRIFLTLSGRGGRADAHPSDVFLQTFHPENPLFEYLKQERLVDFFKTIEKERRLFLYPPFGGIIRLTCRHSTDKKLREEVENVRNQLEMEQKNHRQKTYITVSEIVRKTRERYSEQHIIIREGSTPSNHTPSLSIFETILRDLSRAWTIERNRI